MDSEGDFYVSIFVTEIFGNIKCWYFPILVWWHIFSLDNVWFYKSLVLNFWLGNIRSQPQKYLEKISTLKAIINVGMSAGGLEKSRAGQTLGHSETFFSYRLFKTFVSKIVFF